MAGPPSRTVREMSGFLRKPHGAVFAATRRSVISGLSRELLDQLPALAQQQAAVMRDCVSLPLQVRINDVNPKPRSDDPPFTKAWSSKDPKVPDIEAIAAKWEGRQVE